MSRPTQPLFSPGELAEFQRAALRLSTVMQKLGKDIRTEREMLFLKIGLRASHIEEAAAHGDQERALAHMRKLVALLRQL